MRVSENAVFHVNPATQSHQGAERRAFPRERLMIAAAVKLGPWREPASCVIRDISRQGARLKLVDAYAADIWDVEIEAWGEPRKARIVWRNGRELGVTFNVTPDPVDDQVRALRALIAQRHPNRAA